MISTPFTNFFPSDLLTAEMTSENFTRRVAIYITTIFWSCCFPEVLAAGALDRGSTSALSSARPDVLYSSNISNARYRHYYEMGASAPASELVVVDSIKQFEVEISSIFERLGRNTEFSDTTKRFDNLDRIFLSYRLHSAATDISAAQKRLISKVGLRGIDLAPLLSTPFIRLGSVEVFPRPGFSYLVAGLARRLGIYVRVDEEIRTFGANFRIAFPRYCFSSDVANSTSPVSKEIKVLLNHSMAKLDLLSEIYDGRIGDVNITTFEKSTGYDLAGRQETCPIYGEVESLSGQPGVVLFEESVSKFPVSKRHPYLLQTFRKSNQIHEEMHFISLRPCRTLSSQIDDPVQLSRDRQLSEAQASIGTLAVFAANNDEKLFFVLIDHLDLSGTGEYRRLFDLFYSPLFKSIVEREFQHLKQRARSSQRISLKDVPRYVYEGRMPVSTDQGHFLGMLTFEGVAKPFFTRLTYEKFKSEYGLLTPLQPEQVLSAAVAALAALRDEQNVLCSTIKKF